MLIIRYRRIGKRNYAQYKIVVAERSFSVKGKFIEALGSYNPHDKKSILNKDRINYWIGVGAQCSDSVHNLLISKGIIEGSKRKVSFKGKSKEEEVEVEEATPEKDLKNEKVETPEKEVEEVKKIKEVEGAKEAG